MLDSDCESRQRLAELVLRLPCDVELQGPQADFFTEKSNLTEIAPDSRRRFQRRHLRIFAAIEYRRTVPVLERKPGWHRVYVQNVSRGGLSFLHAEQLFPLERLRMLLPDELIHRMLPKRVRCTVEVTRCRRIQDRCFEIGCRFVDGLG